MKLSNQGLLLLIGVFVILAVWTLLPFPAPRTNDLGYVSKCPFAPWSTLCLLLLAGVGWVIRQYFLTRPPPPPPIS